MTGDLTTIRISKATREQLRRIGRKGKAYDLVQSWLIEMARTAAFLDDIHRILETEGFAPLEEV